MINSIFKIFQRPERGWDPVPKPYAHSYAFREFKNIDKKLISEVEEWVGGLIGKTLLDLGGGPGQYAIEFAKKGAVVCWHDISRNYLDILRGEAAHHGVNISTSLGYMEEATGEYDVVFNRVCWYYCVDDRQFAAKIISLVRPGGSAFLIINNNQYVARILRSMSPIKRTVRWGLFWINEAISIKIGHMMPSHKRILRIFRSFRFKKLLIEERGEFTFVLLRK